MENLFEVLIIGLTEHHGVSDRISNLRNSSRRSCGFTPLSLAEKLSHGERFPNPLLFSESDSSVSGCLFREGSLRAVESPWMEQFSGENKYFCSFHLLHKLQNHYSVLKRTVCESVSFRCVNHRSLWTLRMRAQSHEMYPVSKVLESVFRNVFFARRGRPNPHSKSLIYGELIARCADSPQWIQFINFEPSQSSLRKHMQLSPMTSVS